jgi:hypothetical protein
MVLVVMFSSLGFGAADGARLMARMDQREKKALVAREEVRARLAGT